MRDAEYERNLKFTFDAICKIALIGDSSVGKTNMMLRYTQDNYQPTHIATIGIDFKLKKLQIDDFHMKLQIWDTAGQEKYRTLSSAIYQGADGIALVYSVANRRSFQSIEYWMQSIRQRSKKSVIIALVGNKSDLISDREVSKQEGLESAQKWKANIFYETSALEDMNISNLFEAMARKIKENVLEERKLAKQENENSQKMSLKVPKQSSKLCC